MIPTALKLHTATLDCLGAEDRGATAVEYGLLIGLIAVAVIAVVGIFGDEVLAWFVNSHGAVSEVGVKVANTVATPDD